ncbi:MAG: hypothetical protein IJU60_03065 [Acholeplasmatales bacterium]|nr:hypothetical protein [Acholeplasmatales bacterium]
MNQLLEMLLRFVDEHLDLLIWLIPTIHFSLILLFSALLGMARGFRKSLILFIQSLIIATICFLLFMLFSESEQFDMFLLKTINFFMGGDGSLQRNLGVSTEAKSLREVLILYVPKTLGLADSIALIISDGGQYIMALVNMLYKIFYALFFYIIYLIFVFLFYIIYLIFYPQRRYKRKVIERYYVGDTPYQYKKHKGLGLLLGSFRGLIRATIAMSFIGVSFFVIAGGDGTRKTEDYDYGKIEYDLAYDAYRAIGGYGKHGIYRFLNNFRDADGMPLYLFASDIVLQGSYVDDSGKRTVVYLRNELQQYVKLSRDVADLMMKYKSEEFTKLLKNNYEGNPTDIFMDLFKDKQFCEDLKVIINQFDFSGYILNFAAMVVDIIIDNIESTTITLPVEVKDLLMMLFKEGYFSTNIPYEQELKDSGSKKPLAYLDVNKLLTKDDVTEVLGIALNIFNMSLNGELNLSDKAALIEFIDDMVLKIQRLSIFNGSRKEELDPILMRLYAYVDSVYLASDKVPAFEIRYDDPEYKNISWTTEIASIISVIRGVLPVASEVMEKMDESQEIVISDLIFSLVDKSSPNYARNIKAYDSLVNTIGNSQMLSRVLSSALVRGLITEYLTDFAGEFTIPEGIKYANTYDNNGNLVSYGEIYNLLVSLKIIATSDGIKDLIDQVSNISTPEGAFDFIETAMQVLNSKYEDKTVIDYITSSKLVNLILKTYLVNKGDFGNGIEIYIDDSIIDEDGFIEEAELKALVKHGAGLISVLKPIISSMDEGIDTAMLIDVLKSDEAGAALQSKILEGTISKILVNLLSTNEIVVIPADMQLVSTTTKPSEVKILINIIHENILNIESIIDGSFDAKIIKDIEEDSIDRLLESSIIRSTLSNLLINKGDSLISDFEIVVPNTVIDGTQIKYEELHRLLVNIKDLMPDFDEDGNMKEIDSAALLKQILDNKETLFESDTIIATVANALQGTIITEALGDFLVIPNNLKATSAELKTSSNVKLWRTELDGLFVALDEMFNISEEESFEDIDFEGKIKEAIPNLNEPSRTDPTKTKIEICYGSDILMASLTSSLDKALEGLVSASILTDAKDSKGIYKQEELENLISVIAMFGIDITNPDGVDTDSIVNSIKEELLTYNKPNPKNKNNQSNLDILYSSTIFKGIFSTEIDKILTDASEGKTPVISEDSTMYLKERNRYYKKEEISSIIDLLNVLIEEKDVEEEDGSHSMKKVLDFDTLSEDLLKNINNLLDNNLAIEYHVENEYSNNVEFLYQHNALGLIFGNVLAQADESIKVPSAAYDKPIGYTTDEKVIVKQTEVISLLTILDDFEIDIENVDIEKISLNKIKEDNDLKEKVTSSIIVSSLIYNNIKDNDTNIVFPSSAIERDTKANYIKNSELANLFDGLIYLGITDISNVDIEPMIEIINEDIEAFATTDEIDKIYNSIILRATISGQINNIFIPDMLSEKITSVDCYNIEDKTYTRSEFQSFFYAIYSFNIDLKDFLTDGSDQGELVDEVQSNLMYIVGTENETEFNKLWSSKIIAAIISKIIDDNIGSLIDDERILSSTKIKEDYNDTKFIYKSSEVFAILYNIRVTFGIDALSSDSFSGMDWLSEVKEFSDKKIDDLYNSYLMRHMIGKRLSNHLFDNHLIEESIITSDSVSEYSVGETYFWWIKEEQFKNTVTALNDLGIGNDYSVDLDDLREDDKFEELYASKIIWGIVTKTLRTQIDGSTIKHTDYAYEDDIRLYRKSEVKSLLEVIGTHSLEDDLTSAITINNIKAAIIDNTGGVVSDTPKSYLMLNTISNILLTNNTMHIDQADYDAEKSMLTTLGFDKLVSGIDALGLTDTGLNIDANAIGFDNVKYNKDVIFASPSLRLTITSMVKVSGSVKIFVYDNEAYIKKTYRIIDRVSSEAYSLTKSELVNLIDSFEALGVDGFEWSPSGDEILALRNKSEAEMDEILASNAVKNVIAQFLLDGINVGYISVNYSTVCDDEVSQGNIIMLDTFKKQTNDVLSNTQVKNFFAKLNAMLP